MLDAMVASGCTAEQMAAIIKASLAEDELRAARQIPSPQLRAMAFERDGECCGYCGATEGPFEVDHIVPVAKGGENILSNVKVACRPCNRAKRDRMGEQWDDLLERREKDKLRKREERAKSKPVRNVRGQSGQSKDIADTPPPNDIYSNPPPVTPAANAADPLSDFSDRVVEDWNRQAASTPLPQARKLNTDRRKHLRCRVAEHGEDAVFAAIGAMCRSDFHSGRSGKWTEGSLGWLLKSPENFQKMLERADGEVAKPAPAAQPRIAGGSLFDQLRAGEITDAEFHAARAKLERSAHPPPTHRERPQAGSVAQFIPKIVGSA
jgi:hypothetical protein